MIEGSRGHQRRLCRRESKVLLEGPGRCKNWVVIDLKGVKIKRHVGRGMVVMMRKGGVRLVQAVIWHHGSVQFLVILLHHQIGGRDDLRRELRRSLARCL